MKKLIIIVLSTLLILILLLSPMIHAQSPSATILTIEGQLTNGTSGQPVPAEIPLMLHVFEGRQMTNMIDGQTGPNGTFLFEEIESVPDRSFGVMATVGRTTYFSDVVAPSPDQTRLDLPVTIYDTSSDDSVIRIEQMHTLIDFFSPALVEISDIYIVSNEGDRTVEGAVTPAGGQAATLEFTLPEGAQNLSFEHGELGQRFLQTETGFADTFGIPPGQGTGQITVRYYLLYEAGLSLSRSVSYPTSKVGVIIPQLGVTVTSDDLTFDGVNQLPDGRTVDVFAADNLQTGQSFTLELAGQPELNVVSTTPQFIDEGATAPPTRSATPPWPMLLGLGLAVVGVGFIGGSLWWWRQQSTSKLVNTGKRHKADLILAIAELDDAYDAGAIAEADYLHQRHILRAELKALLEPDDRASGANFRPDEPLRPVMESELIENAERD